MARDMVSTRIELDRQVDTNMRTLARAEDRNSKREMIALLCKRISRLWNEKPEALREMGIIRD